MQKTIIELSNFEGFDYSWIDAEMNNVAQMESEYYAEEYNLSDEKKEEIREDYFSQNFEELKEEICKVYAQNYFNDIEFETDIELNAEFESLGSQQTWLCRLDRFFVEVPTNKAQSLLNWILNNRYEELKEIVRDRFTSRDGYVPHYPKNLNKWGKISRWDHNQIGTALLVFFDDNDFNYDMHEKVSEIIYGRIFNTLSDEMQDFLNKEYDKKEAKKAQLSLF
jgi:hypothetical protein